MPNFPGSLDTTGAGTLRSNHVNNVLEPIDATAINELALATVAAETKIGAGSSTPTTGLVLTGGSTAGTSAWAAPVTGSSVETDVWVGTGINAGTTDDTVALNALFAVAGNYVLRPKTYTISNSLWIRSSHTKIRLLPGAIVRLATNANQPMLVIGNYGSGVTLTDIWIEGGEWDGNAVNQNAHLPNIATGPAWTGHALELSGLTGIAFWDVSRITVKDVYVHHTSNTGYSFNKTSDVNCVNCRSDSSGFISTLKSGTVGVNYFPSGADHESTNNFSVISNPTTPALVTGGYRFIGCSILNLIDAGFDLHGTGANEFIVDGCSVIGTCPPGATGAAQAGWAYSFEMEQADNVDGGHGVLSNFIARDVTHGVVINNNQNPFLNLEGMAIGPGRIENCEVAFDLYGRHMSVTGVTTMNCGTGFTSNNIGPWGNAAGTASSGTTTTLTSSGFGATNSLAGYYLAITGGSAVGQIRRIVSNTATVLTVAPAFSAAITSSSTYSVTLNGDWTFTGCEFHISPSSLGFGQAGAYLNAGAGTVIDGINFSGCNFYGPGAQTTINGTLDPHAQQYSAGIITRSSAGGAILNLSINGCMATGFNHGLELGSPYPVQVMGGIYHHNRDAGIRIDDGASVQIIGARCHENGINSDSGQAAGIELNAGVSAYIADCILGNTTGLGVSTGSQQWGINIGGGTGAIINGGDFRNNVSGAITGHTTTTVQSIRGVRGYNDALSGTPAITVTTGTFTNPAYFRDYQVRLIGGTVTAVTIGGISSGVTSNPASPGANFFVPAGSALVVTNSVAPTAFPIYQ